MKPLRIYLWPGRALVLGTEIDSRPHAHHALQMTQALAGSFLVERGGVETRCTAACLLPGEMHRISSDGALLAHCFIEPGHRALHALRREAVPALPAPLCEGLTALWDGQALRGDVEALAQAWCDVWLPGFELAPSFDARVAKALQHWAQDRECTAAELAAHVALSPGRFAHLFREHTGLPMRRYLLWMRLLAVVDHLASGSNLTEAAHAAGFADLAHMSRVFHATFGVVPSTLTRNQIVD